MINKSKLLSVILTLLLCLSLAITTSATSTFEIAGIYGKIHGSSSESTSETYMVNTTTTISRNPDTAYLLVEADFCNGSQTIHATDERSSRGVLSFSVGFPIFFDIQEIPEYAYFAHNVRGGSQSESGFVCYTSVDVTLN